jgi:uncharacterized DUF497 family protein
MEFEWDLTKESVNIKKHGVTFTEASTCFNDSAGIQFTDSTHSQLEKRFFWVGESSAGRILTTRFTLRGDTIRIFGSAEWRKFRRLYDEATKTKGR